MEMQDLGYDYVKLLKEKIKELEQKLAEAEDSNYWRIQYGFIAGLKDDETKRLIACDSKLAIAVEAMTEARKTIMPIASADYEYYAIGLLDIALAKIGVRE